MSRCSIVSFDIRILGWFAWLDIEQGNLLLWSNLRNERRSLLHLVPTFLTPWNCTVNFCGPSWTQSIGGRQVTHQQAPAPATSRRFLLTTRVYKTS